MRFVIGFVVMIVVGVGGLLFTPSGNQTLISPIQQILTKRLQIPVQIRSLKIRPFGLFVQLQVGKEDILSFQGAIKYLPLRIEGHYEVAIEDLYLYRHLLGKALHGPLKTGGAIEGAPMSMVQIEGAGKILGGFGQYRLHLRSLAIDRATAQIEKLQIAHTLAMFGMPLYAQGMVDADIDLRGLGDVKKMEGHILVHVSQGELDQKVMRQEQNLTFNHDIPFVMQAKLHIEHGVAQGFGDLQADRAISLHLSPFRYDFAKAHAHSDFVLDLHDLRRLKGWIKRPLYGALHLQGTIEKGPTESIKAWGKMLGGAIEVQWRQKSLALTAHQIQLEALAQMLGYPPFFDAQSNATFHFNTYTKQGRLQAHLQDGQILSSDLTRLVHALSGFDLRREIYTKGNLDATIDHDRMRLNLQLKSSKSSLEAHDALLDLSSGSIDALLNLHIPSETIPVVCGGTLEHPTFRPKVSRIIKRRVKRVMQKALQKRLQKKVKSWSADELLKRLF